MVVVFPHTSAFRLNAYKCESFFIHVLSGDGMKSKFVRSSTIFSPEIRTMFKNLKNLKLC